MSSGRFVTLERVDVTEQRVLFGKNCFERQKKTHEILKRSIALIDPIWHTVVSHVHGYFARLNLTIISRT